MNEATYCPEDNKLRLYVGRVPREEYLALRAGGWTSTPKQDCDFTATWTPAREDQALEYGEGYIGDEDQSPTDRAADRAERFGGYCDKRRDEATGHADAYDAGPRVHGYQNAERAERAAARHDRQANRACDQWRKAEYWAQRTAGVISHALYVSKPGVRMGRIKRIETELRGLLSRWEGREMNESGKRWKDHFELRLSYERQMLDAQGGRAGDLDIVPGGRFLGALIVKVNTSNTTGRVVSVHVKCETLDSGWHYRAHNVPGCDFALAQLDVEREGQHRYTPPTEADLAELAQVKKAMTAATKKQNAGKPKLINPTKEDAERLQGLINERLRADHEKRCPYAAKDFEPLDVLESTQEVYSHNSKGAYAAAGTVEMRARGVWFRVKGWSSEHRKAREQAGPVLCKVRMHRNRVIVLTDKPQKPFPAAVWEAYTPEPVEETQKEAAHVS